MAPQFFCRKFWVSMCLLTVLSVVCVYAQSNDNNHKHNTYAVVGAFSVQNNAQRLVKLVAKYNFSAAIRKNENRGLFYVYIDESGNRKQILEKVNDLKSQYSEFYDAWAYTGDFTDHPEVVSTESVSEHTLQESTVASEVVSTGVADPTLQKEKTEIKKQQADLEVNTFEKKEGHYYLYFNAINTKNLKEVKGNINIIDPERAKHLKEAKSHQLVELRDPDNGTQRVKIATNIFGFREIQYILDLDNPQQLAENPDIKLVGDSIIVNFDLQRFKKGDVLVMYNVYFFKDAAIMKPESIYELNSLLDMLKENENLVVRIHGHTNGNSHGKIIHLDLDDKNFFGINGNHKESFGSAKKLSLYRSYTIQHWLMEQGVHKDRMEIKGWGGKRMIYDKHSTQADQNVRVEVEILEE